MLQPADKILKTMAIEFAEYQVSLLFSFNPSIIIFRSKIINHLFLDILVTDYLFLQTYTFMIYQVCVDVFITTQTYIDIASISVIPRTTGGQVTEKLYNFY